MKRWNRKNELLADAAERASVAAMWLGTAGYPAKKLEDAWTLVLGSQMHDILPGTSLPKCYEYSWNDEVLALNQFAAVTTDAVGAILKSMDTQAQGVAVAVYNPLSIDREDVVEASIAFDSGIEAPAVQVIGPDGNEVPSQVIGRHEGVTKVLFLAKVPSVGIAMFDVRPAAHAERTQTVLRADEKGLENERYRVSLDGNGDVASIFDKQSSREVLSAPARLAFTQQNPDDYPAWNMDWSDQSRPPYAYVDGPAKVRVVESGPVRVAIEVEREAQGSRFLQRIQLSAGSAGDRIEFDNQIDWRTRQSSLKATFPLGVTNDVATYDIQQGTIQRPTDNPKLYEVPSHQWFDLTASDGGFGVSVLKDSKYGSDKPDDHTLRLTLLYTPGVHSNYQDQATQDIGRHEILYALAPHAKDWQSAKTPWQAARLNQPLRPFICGSHAGQLGREYSMLKVDNDQVAVVAMKKAEDGDGVIVRVRELTGRAAEHVRLKFPTTIASAREVDGQERPIGDVASGIPELSFDMEPYGLRAFELKLGPGSKPGTAPECTAVMLPYDTDAVSTDRNRADGSFDADGRTLAAEQLPAEIVSDGVHFKIGPTDDGKANAVSCQGQTIALPAGDFDKVYILAAAANDDVDTELKIDDQPRKWHIEDWGGYIGQWDNRLWKGEVPEQVFDWRNELDGLVPGYIKRDTVAWFSSHRHHPKAGNEYYQYSYLFKYGFDLPKAAKTITLPASPRTKVFAVTVVRNSHDSIRPAQPLYDTFESHAPDAPTIHPAAGKLADAVHVSIDPPLYYRDGGLRYTLDGTEPTEQSPVYAGPFWLTHGVDVNARVFLSGGAGPVASAHIEVNDVTPPSIKSATAISGARAVRVEFSEPVVKDSAGDAKAYRFEPALSVESAAVDSDGQSVVLKLAEPLSGSDKHALIVTGIEDVSKNKLNAAQIPGIEPAGPICSLEQVQAGGKADEALQVANLPVKSGATWSMNLFVRVEQLPGNRTPIAGFGSTEATDAGTGRYFAKFANGIHFWSHGRDVESHTPMDVAKWQMLTATYDGVTLRMFKNGSSIGQRKVELADDESVIHVAPLDPWDKQRQMSGEVRGFTIWDRALSDAEIKLLVSEMPSSAP